MTELDYYRVGNYWHDEGGSTIYKGPKVDNFKEIVDKLFLQKLEELVLREENTPQDERYGKFRINDIVLEIENALEELGYIAINPKGNNSATYWGHSVSDTDREGLTYFYEGMLPKSLIERVVRLEVEAETIKNKIAAKRAAKTRS